MSRRVVITWLGAALVGAVPAAAQPAAPQIPWPPASLQVCEQLLVREPDNLRSYLCFTAVVRAGRGSRDAAFSRISVLTNRPAPSPHALYVRALMLADRNDPSTEAAYGKAIASYDAAADPRGQVRGRVYLSTYRSMMDLDRQSEPLADAERIAKASGDAQLMALVTVEQAWSAYRSTDYGRALRLLESVETLVRGKVASDLQTKWLSCRGATLWALGEPDRARATYEQELILHRQTGNAYDEAVTLGNLALLSVGDQRARFSREGVALARRVGNASGEITALSMLAASLPDADALRHLRVALAVARRVDDREGISRAQRMIGSRLVTADRAGAQAALDEAVAVSRTCGDPNEVVRNLIVRSTMRWEVGPRERAMAESVDVLDAIEALRNLQPEHRVRAQRFGQWRGAYLRASGHLLAGHLLAAPARPSDRDWEAAFRMSERLRARLLLDRLDASRAVIPVKADAAVLQRRRAILDRISQTNRNLTVPGLGADTRRRLLANLESAEREEAEVSAALVKASPTFALVRQPTLATLADVQQTLADDEALIAFQIFSITTLAGEPYGAWRWVITRQRVDVRPVARVDELFAAVQIFLGLATSGDTKAASAAAQIHGRIFADALDRLPAHVRRLVIVPDDPLFQVPFDALRAGVDAPPLAQRFAISLAPSATTWWRLRHLAPPHARQAVLVYADPEGRSAWPTPALGVGAVATRADGTLAPLPGSRREGRVAQRTLSGDSRVRLGRDASETAFKHDGFANYRILHFAAHAVLDSAHPERTAVLLAPSDDDDGMLQVREIIDLPLSGQAVILSACQSASGTMVPAEGLFGLSHAFVLAGARVVVANLWPVRDRDAADFMELMYDGLGDGLSVRDAVHRARVASIARGKPVSAWAGMVVMGDGDLVLDAGGPRVRWYHLTALALFAWSVAAGMRRRHRLPRRAALG